MHVPCGVCAGDKLRLFDMARRRKSIDFIEVPSDAYDGKMLDYENPPEGYKLLSGDGDGHVVGGTPINQHAVRLAIHKEMCKDPKCNFMGCVDHSGTNLFMNVSKDDIDQYKVYWNASRRAGIRKFMMELKRASL